LIFVLLILYATNYGEIKVYRNKLAPFLWPTVYIGYDLKVNTYNVQQHTYNVQQACGLFKLVGFLFGVALLQMLQMFVSIFTVHFSGPGRAIDVVCVCVFVSMSGQ